jgi:hypothetical protein
MLFRSPRSFEDQAASEKAQLVEQATKLPYGPEKDRLLRKIRQLDTALHLSEWLSSPGLASPVRRQII